MGPPVIPTLTGLALFTGAILLGRNGEKITSVEAFIEKLWPFQKSHSLTKSFRSRLSMLSSDEIELGKKLKKVELRKISPKIFFFNFLLKVTFFGGTRPKKYFWTVFDSRTCSVGHISYLAKFSPQFFFFFFSLF